MATCEGPLAPCPTFARHLKTSSHRRILQFLRHLSDRHASKTPSRPLRTRPSRTARLTPDSTATRHSRQQTNELERRNEDKQIEICTQNEEAKRRKQTQTLQPKNQQTAKRTANLQITKQETSLTGPKSPTGGGPSILTTEQNPTLLAAVPSPAQAPPGGLASGGGAPALYRG